MVQLYKQYPWKKPNTLTGASRPLMLQQTDVELLSDKRMDAAVQWDEIFFSAAFLFLRFHRYTLDGFLLETIYLEFCESWSNCFKSCKIINSISIPTTATIRLRLKSNPRPYTKNNNFKKKWNAPPAWFEPAKTQSKPLIITLTSLGALVLSTTVLFHQKGRKCAIWHLIKPYTANVYGDLQSIYGEIRV